MAANHVEHEIATFPGSPGRGGQQRRAMKREAEEDWHRWPIQCSSARQLVTMKTAARRTAMQRPARPPWWHLPKAGGAN